MLLVAYTIWSADHCPIWSIWALPTDLQPLMRHLCPDEQDTLQQPVLDRAKATHLRTRWGFRQLEKNPDSLARANAYIRVPISLPEGWMRIE